VGIDAAGENKGGMEVEVVGHDNRSDQAHQLVDRTCWDEGYEGAFEHLEVVGASAEEVDEEADGHDAYKESEDGF